MTIFGNGLVCGCGSVGCVERYVGAGYVVERTRRRIRAHVRRLARHRNQTALFGVERRDGPSRILDLAGGDLSRITMREIGRAARAGDRLAVEVVEEVGFFLGLGLANAVQLVDPERVVIGGGVAGIGAPLLRAVRRAVYRCVPMFPGRRLEVVRARLGLDAGVVGAASLRREEGGAAKYEVARTKD
jgi:glucokinase